MSTELAGSSQDSSESKPLSTEQARQILRTAPDALESYLVATMPKRGYQPKLYKSIAFVWGLLLAAGFVEFGVRYTRIGQQTHATYYFLGALAFPLIATFAHFDAKRTAKGLTSDCEYQKVLTFVIWQKVNAYLLICYLLLFALFFDLSNAIKVSPLR